MENKKKSKKVIIMIIIIVIETIILGISLLYSSAIYFDTIGLPYVQGTNPVSFRTELANDGSNLRDDNYSIEWLDDSVKIIFRGEETGGDNVYQIPYYNQ